MRNIRLDNEHYELLVQIQKERRSGPWPVHAVRDLIREEAQRLGIINPYRGSNGTTKRD